MCLTGFQSSKNDYGPEINGRSLKTRIFMKCSGTAKDALVSNPVELALALFESLPLVQASARLNGPQSASKGSELVPWEVKARTRGPQPTRGWGEVKLA